MKSRVILLLALPFFLSLAAQAQNAEPTTDTGILKISNLCTQFDADCLQQALDTLANSNLGSLILDLEGKPFSLSHPVFVGRKAPLVDGYYAQDTNFRQIIHGTLECNSDFQAANSRGGDFALNLNPSQRLINKYFTDITIKGNHACSGIYLEDNYYTIKFTNLHILNPKRHGIFDKQTDTAMGGHCLIVRDSTFEVTLPSSASASPSTLNKTAIELESADYLLSQNTIKNFSTGIKVSLIGQLSENSIEALSPSIGISSKFTVATRNELRNTSWELASTNRIGVTSRNQFSAPSGSSKAPLFFRIVSSPTRLSDWVFSKNEFHNSSEFPAVDITQTISEAKIKTENLFITKKNGVSTNTALSANGGVYLEAVHTAQASNKAVYSFKDSVQGFLCPNPKVTSLDPVNDTPLVWSVSKMDIPKRQVEVTFASHTKYHPAFMLGLDCR